MKLTVLGARGSIPCSGKDVVKYGGETTSALVETADGNLIILDLGTGVRLLGNEILKNPDYPKDFHVLLTHAHWDHLMGFPFFAPIYSEEYTLYFHGWGDAQRSVRSLFEEAMKPPFFPVDLNNVAAKLDFNEDPKEFYIGNVKVNRFPLCHPNGGCGFSLEEDGKRLCFFPDNELGYDHPGCKSYDSIVEFCKGTQVLIHDAEYYQEEYEKFTRGFGHTVFEEAVKLGLDAEVERLLLWHHKPERTDEQIDSIQERARQIAKDASSSMVCDAACKGMVIEL